MVPAKMTIFSPDTAFASHVQLHMHTESCPVTIIANEASSLGVLYMDPPDLLLMDFITEPLSSFNVVSTLRNDSFFSTIPIIGLINDVEEEALDWEHCLLDDVIGLPINFNELSCRISLALSRIKRIFDNNPLTRLPGNASIQRALEATLGTATAVCYIDINDFKPYNDKFGFSHGDEVLRMTSRIISNAVRDAGGGFCGHIGGDDFVCILPLHQVESTCQTIITHFDLIVLDLFDETTKQRGYFLGTNRKGEQENIPLLSISIGIVPMNMPKIIHTAKVAEVAAELKKLAKKSGGSSIVVDNRSS